MLMMPKRFNESLFDEFMEEPFERFFQPEHDVVFGKRGKNLLKTDVKEKNGNYEVEMDLPGFHKEDVKVQLENGYLTVSASRGMNKDKKDNEGNYIRRERYAGECARSFYVGDAVKQEEVKAKFENGILTLTIPKKQEKKALPSSNFIAIE